MKAHTFDSLMQWINWPEWAKDAVVVDVDLVLDWRDILLLIWRRGRLGVSVKTFTEVVVGGPQGGRTESISRILIQRIRWPWQRPLFAVADVPQREG